MADASYATLSNELLQCFGRYVVRHLSLHSLAYLSCTSTSLRTVAYQHPTVWITAAAVHLPPLHPVIVPDLGVAGVQAVMQRRAAAAANALSGRCVSDRELHWLEEPNPTPLGRVAWAGFADDASRLAVLTRTRLALVDSDSGQIIWWKLLTEYKAAVPTQGSCFLQLAWVRGAGYMIGCFGCSEEYHAERAHSTPLQLFSIDALNGNLSMIASVSLFDLGMLRSQLPWAAHPDEAFRLGLQDISCSFSPSGQHLVCTGVILEEYQVAGSASRQRLADAVQVLDLHGAVIIQSPRCGQRIRCSISSQFTWSSDGSVMFDGVEDVYSIPSCSIMTVRNTTRNDCHELYGPASFDQTCQRLGYSEQRGRDPRGRQSISTCFVSLSTGAVEVEVEKLCFAGFCKMLPHAFLTDRDAVEVHVWNVESRTPLHRFAVQIPHVSLQLRTLLDDRILVVKAHEGNILMDACSGELGLKVRPLRGHCAHALQASPDECSFIFVDDRRQEEHCAVRVIKLA